MIPDLPADIDHIKGFLADDEAQALYQHALALSAYGPVLEIGSYCGKSTIYLGLACRHNNSTVFALDHHRGSEEHQLGEFFHDPALYDAGEGIMDTFREFRRNIRRAGLDDVVVPVVAGSEAAASIKRSLRAFNSLNRESVMRVAASAAASPSRWMRINCTSRIRAGSSSGT